MISFEIRGRGFRPFNTNWWPRTQRQWAPVLLRDNQRFWRQERNPNNGRPWAPLTPKYRAWKQGAAPGQPILRLTGRMQDSARIVPSGTGFRVQTTRYGAFHQFGTSRMVARPWVGLPPISMRNLTPLAWRNILSLNRT